MHLTISSISFLSIVYWVTQIHFLSLRAIADILSFSLITADILSSSTCTWALFKQIILVKTLKTARRISLSKFIASSRGTVANILLLPLITTDVMPITPPVPGFCSNKPYSLKRWKLYGRFYRLSSFSFPDLFHVKDWSWHSAIITSHHNRCIA